MTTAILTALIVNLIIFKIYEDAKAYNKKINDINKKSTK